MGKIIYIMGKSSTGKDTIYKKLISQNEVPLKPFVPYTTRPIRQGEQNGVEYFFTDEDGFQRMKAQGIVVEDRAYQTMNGLWRYFTVDDGQIDLESCNYINIGTIESYESMVAYFGRERMLPILIELDDGERLYRALMRERQQEKPKYEELCRRYLADGEDFSQKKIAAAGITKRFENHQSDECTREILEYIKEQLAQ